MVPDRFALIVGAMKCGTTTLFELLGTHPEVAACRVKEPDFFCADDFEPARLDEYGSLWDWRPGRHRVALEASANYSKIPTLPDCAERIASCPEADFRFIYCMRHPIDRIESHVYHGLYAGWTRPLDDGISAHTIAVSRYAMQLDAYATRFGKERIFLVVLEEFVQGPAEILRQLCAFLDVDPGVCFASPGASRNPASAHYLEHPAWTRLRQIPLLTALARVVPPGVRRSLNRATGRTIEARRKVSPAERSDLEEMLRPDLRRLRSEYGIDASAIWGIDLG